MSWVFWVHRRYRVRCGSTAKLQPVTVVVWLEAQPPQLLHILKTVILGQMLSLFICGTAVTSQYLAEQYQVNTPMFQSFINYSLLLLVYTTMLAFRTGSDSLWQILKQRWWKYIFLGLADVEANYMIVKAYQYTTLTSVQDSAIQIWGRFLIQTVSLYTQLLDCFGIPVLMALSWFILRARYRLIHFLAVAVCLLGVGTMVGADILAGRQDSEACWQPDFSDFQFSMSKSKVTSEQADFELSLADATEMVHVPLRPTGPSLESRGLRWESKRRRSDVVIGDVLVLLGASLYAISNVSEEYIVKNLSRVEFLGMVGLFGTIISGLQLAIVEHREIMRIQWNWKIALLFTVFALCMFGLYSFMPVVIKVTSATSVNLGILTADLYSLFFGLFLFFYKFSGLYILSFVIIMVGFILYCSTPTRTAEPSALPQLGSTGLDNAALKLEENDSETPAITVQFTRGETVVE
ncbi:hypothetical protein QYF61_005702 [Mycteria americana]|uniref:Solute carrier family 35 member F2 n=1 Tax=Mycteria americana TaxID=33587 RepID=A0AAN7NQA9_MYCAM|nr:hypothetical protein QYF61_005702 [Mycteria americana]